MTKVFRGKKGIDYAVLLAVIVIISVVVLYINLNKKVESTEKFMGDTQSGVLRINNEVLYYQAYINKAAQLSIKAAVDDMARFPQFQGLPASGTTADGCIILNTEEDPTRLSHTPSFHEGINVAFNNQMNKHLKEYAQKTGYEIPPGNFKVSAFTGELIGVAVKPTRIPVKDYAGRKMGDAYFRPSFKIKYDHKIDEYPRIFDILAKIAKQCSFRHITECDLIETRDWSVSHAGYTLTFHIPIGIKGIKESCYVLSIPQPTT